MSIKIDVPLVGMVEIVQFTYSSGRKGLLARTEADMKAEEFFNLTVNVEGQYPKQVALKEYDRAQLVNKYLMEMDNSPFILVKKAELGHNYIHYCSMKKSFAK